MKMVTAAPPVFKGLISSSFVPWQIMVASHPASELINCSCFANWEEEDEEKEEDHDEDDDGLIVGIGR